LQAERVLTLLHSPLPLRNANLAEYCRKKALDDAGQTSKAILMRSATKVRSSVWIHSDSSFPFQTVDIG
jgi:hypothetical protein